jgi:hypothetical protein
MENGLPALTIPPRFRSGIARIGSLGDASFSDLIEALKKSPEAENAEKLANTLSSDVKSISKSDLRQIVAAISSMQSIQNRSHASPIKFAADLWDALQEDSPELIGDIDAETFKRHAEILLTDTPVHLVAAKVADVRREVERYLCGARILTDVRPAFPEDATKRPAMTIMNTLEIQFHDDLGEHRELYVNVDDDDLEALKHAIDRAFTKKKTLVKELQKAKFDVYG